MLIKIHLKLKRESPSHLPLHKFLELIKEDETLTPTTKIMLESLKKAHQNYVPIPLEHDVILSSSKAVTLHKDKNVKVWTLESWTDNNKKEFNKSEINFLNKILFTYIKMGYEYTIETINMEEVDKILSDLETLATKTKKRLKRLGI